MCACTHIMLMSACKCECPSMLVCSSQKIMLGTCGIPLCRVSHWTCCFWLGWLWECRYPVSAPFPSTGMTGSCGCAQLLTWCWSPELRPCFRSEHSYPLSRISNLTIILDWLQCASWESDRPVCVHVWVYAPLPLKVSKVNLNNFSPKISA